jgi:hypothetical protein
MSEKSDRLELLRWKIERLLETRSEWTLDQNAEYLALIEEETALLDLGEGCAAQEA